MKNLYSNPLMSNIRLDKVLDNLSKAYSSSKNYDVYNVDGYSFVFVLGLEDEKNVPFWELPIMVEGATERIVYVDLRKYVGNVKEEPSFIMDVCRDKDGAKFMIMHAIISSLIDKGELGVFKPLQDSLAAIFSKLMVGIIRTYLDLDFVNTVNVDIVSNIYVHNMFLKDYSPMEKKSLIKARLKESSNFKLMDMRALDVIIDSVNLDASNFQELINNIKSVLGEKAEFINYEATFTAASTLWYGPGGVNTTLAHLEDLATMIVMYQQAFLNPKYKRSRISMVANDMGRKVEKKEFERIDKVISKYVTM